MPKVATLESKVFNGRISIYAKRMLDGRISVNLKSGLRHKSCQLSDLNTKLSTMLDPNIGEFLLKRQGNLRPITEEVRKADIFIDTGRRIESTNNLWAEVWRLTPEQLAQLKQKEKQNVEAPSDHQPQCGP